MSQSKHGTQKKQKKNKKNKKQKKQNKNKNMALSAGVGNKTALTALGKFYKDYDLHSSTIHNSQDVEATKVSLLR